MRSRAGTTTTFEAEHISALSGTYGSMASHSIVICSLLSYYSHSYSWFSIDLQSDNLNRNPQGYGEQHFSELHGASGLDGIPNSCSLRGASLLSLCILDIPILMLPNSTFDILADFSKVPSISPYRTRQMRWCKSMFGCTAINVMCNHIAWPGEAPHCQLRQELA